MAICVGIVISANAGAETFTDFRFLGECLSGTGTFQWTHELPQGFSVPPYAVTKGEINIASFWNDGSDDTISIQNTIIDVPLAESNWGFLNITNIDLGTLFYDWDENDDALTVNLEYSELGRRNSLWLAASCITLEYGLVDPIGPSGSGGGAPVPEPATMILLGVGLVGIAVIGKRKLTNGYK